MQEIQQTSKFLWVGNWAALDFINTDIVVEQRPVDLLEGSQDFVQWLGESGLCRREDLKDNIVPRRLIDDARAYRGLLRRGIEGYVQQGGLLPRELFLKTNEILSRNASIRQLLRADKGYRVETRWQFQGCGDYLMPVAESFAKLVTEADVDRIRKCKNPECVLYFYDISKGGQRSWCSLDICGNKLRMAASRRRSESGEGKQAGKRDLR